MRALAQTQVVIALTITTNREAQLVTILQLLFSLALLLSDAWHTLLTGLYWVVDLAEAIGFVVKIYHIAWIAWRWGLGI